MIACGLGHISHAGALPSLGRWARLIDTVLDGLRAPSSGSLPQPL